MNQLRSAGNTQAQKDDLFKGALVFSGSANNEFTVFYYGIADDMLNDGANMYADSAGVGMIASRNPGVITYLHSRNYKLDTQDAQGKTILHSAVMFNNHDAIRTLAKLGANMEVENHQKLTPLGYVVYWWAGSSDPVRAKAYEATFKVLILNGANINGKFSDKKHTPLHQAARFNREDIIKILVAAGANPSIRDQNGASIADALAEGKALEIHIENERQRKLAEARADPGLLMGAVGIAGAVAQGYVASRQGVLPPQSTGAMTNESGRTRPAQATANTAASSAAQTANVFTPSGYKDSVSESWQRQLAAPKYTENLGTVRSQEATESAARSVALQNWENTKRRIESEHDRRLTYGRILSVASPQCAPSRGMRTKDEPEGRLMYWSCGVAYSVELAGPRGTGEGFAR